MGKMHLQIFGLAGFTGAGFLAAWRRVMFS
jgi:hypothetical protein